MLTEAKNIKSHYRNTGTTEMSGCICNRSALTSQNFAKA